MEQYSEKEEMGQHTEPLLPLFIFLQESVAFILVPRTRGSEINATFAFLFILGVSVPRAVPGGW
jgi:hypothetical protein